MRQRDDARQKTNLPILMDTWHWLWWPPRSICEEREPNSRHAKWKWNFFPPLPRRASLQNITTRLVVKLQFALKKRVYLFVFESKMCIQFARCFFYYYYFLFNGMEGVSAIGKAKGRRGCALFQDQRKEQGQQHRAEIKTVQVSPLEKEEEKFLDIDSITAPACLWF